MADTVYALFVNEERTVLIRMWENGVVEVCLREDAADIWGPPIRMKREELPDAA
jgi:hypothetical protein